MCETNNSEWKRCILSIRNSIDNCAKTTRIKPNFASLNKKMELGNPAFMRVSGLFVCGVSTV